jgi:hypothetical protein
MEGRECLTAGADGGILVSSPPPHLPPPPHTFDQARQCMKCQTGSTGSRGGGGGGGGGDRGCGGGGVGGGSHHRLRFMIPIQPGIPLPRRHSSMRKATARRPPILTRLPPTVRPYAAEPPAVEAFILAVGSRRSGGNSYEIKEIVCFNVISPCFS